MKHIIAMMAALLLSVAQASAADYFFSATGSDANACTQTSPCQTLTKAQSLHLNPGDTLQFNGGDNFPGCLVLGPANVTGDAANPVQVHSYGTGRGIITSTCTGNLVPAIDIVGVNGVTIRGLKVVGDSAGNTHTGIMVEGPADTIVLHNNEVTGFYGAEIMILGLGSYQGVGCNAINNIEVSGNLLHGALPTSSDSQGIYGFGCGTNITNANYLSNVAYNMGAGLPNLPPANGIACSAANCVVSGNVVYNIGANATQCGGPTGIIVTNGTATVQFNRVWNVKPTVDPNSGCDWVGIDFDINGIGEARYNYVHDNAGACFLVFEATGPASIHHNICVNNDTISKTGAQMSLNATGAAPIHVYQNTMWIPGVPSPTQSAGACWNFGFAGSGTVYATIENNTCYTGHENQFGVSWIANNAGGADVSGVILRNNIYIANNGSAQFNWNNTSLDLPGMQAIGQELGSVGPYPN